MLTSRCETTTIRELANSQGLDIDPETINVNEMGPDFQVAIAEAAEHAESLADLLTELHTVDPSIVRPYVIAEFSPAEVRQRKRNDIAAVVAEFDVAQNLCDRRAEWLDSTTVAIGDPARDFMFHQASVSLQNFDATIRRYVQTCGRVWPKFAEHWAEPLDPAGGARALPVADR